MISQPMFAACGFLLGLVFGSFLNVCIVRLPRRESVASPRSHCRACGQTIRWFDNLPLLSWIFLRGRCRTCRASISWHYPAVELATALWFAFIAYRVAFQRFQLSILPDNIPSEAFIDLYLSHLSLAILGFLLIGLLVMDWQTFRLPDAFTLTGLAIGIFLICTQAIFLGPREDQVLLRHKAPITAAMSVEKGNVFLTGPEALIGGRLVAILAAAALLLAIRAAYKFLRHREGMGLGDIKLLTLIAAFLGFWPAILAFFLGVLAAATYAVAVLALRRASPTTRLPFGSFLAAGGLIAAAFGPGLIARYTSLFP